MKNFIQKIIIVFLLFLDISYAHTTLKIASANKDDSYDKLAQSIKKIIEENSEYKLQIVNTKGSVDNIKRLEEGEIDLAIVQNDAAFYAQEGLEPFSAPLTDLQMILAFYDEPIYIVTNQKNINSIEQLENMRINVGQKKSGLLASSQVLLNSTHLWEHITPFYYDPQKSLEYLKNEKVQVIFLNVLDDETKRNIKKNKWRIVPIRANIIAKLQKTFYYFSAFDVGDNIYTLAVKSILISKNTLDNKVTYDITKILYEHYGELVFPALTNDKNDCFCANSLSSWHEGTKRFFDDRKINPRSFHDDKYVIYYGIGAALLILFLTVLLAIYIAYKRSLQYSIKPSKNFFLNSFKIISLKIIDHKYIVFVIVVLALYLTCIFLIKYFEHQWAVIHNISSPFDNLSLKESLMWLFIFATSSYNDGIFPCSGLGKFFVSIIPMIGLGGLLAFATLVASDNIKKFLLEVKGMGSVKDENHIILCGWNKGGCNIVEALTHKNIRHKKNVVILAPEKEKKDIEHCILNKKNVVHIVGNAKSREDLQRANLQKACTVVVLQDETHTDPDAYAILDVLTIRRYADELGIRDDKGFGFQIILQLLNDNNKQIAIDAGADQIIALANIESKLLSNMIQTPGINHFVEEVFNYNDANDIYSFDIKSGCSLEGKTYSEVLSLLKEYNILLLSINIEYHRDENEINDIKTKYKLDRGVITNPINNAENNYEIQIGDKLIVLAQYEEIVLDTVAKLNTRIKNGK